MTAFTLPTPGVYPTHVKSGDFSALVQVRPPLRTARVSFDRHEHQQLLRLEPQRLTSSVTSESANYSEHKTSAESQRSSEPAVDQLRAPTAKRADREPNQSAGNFCPFGLPVQQVAVVLDDSSVVGNSHGLSACRGSASDVVPFALATVIFAIALVHFTSRMRRAAFELEQRRGARP